MPNGLISVDEAWARIKAHRVTPPTQTVTLEDAVGLTLAEPVIAAVTQPPLSVSAMDGYAVRFADVTETGSALSVIGESPAGTPFEGSLRPGEAVRIFTGGGVPVGADHVVIQEDTSREENAVVITDAQSGPGNIRRAGLDFAAGDTLIEAGTRLEPAHVSVAAAANHARLTVYRRPRVAIIANGNELKPPGSALGAGEIISSSPVGLVALIRSWGGDAKELGIAGDTVDAIQSMIRSARDADIIVPVGGASVGDHDHMRAAFDGAGLTSVFAKVAVKPGKPTWFGRLGQQRVLGLPGNPASAWVCAHLFLRALLGLDQDAMTTGSLSEPLGANGAREAFLRGRAEIRGSDGIVVTPLPRQDSSLMLPFLQANVLIRRPVNAPGLNPGDTVDLIRMGAL